MILIILLILTTLLISGTAAFFSVYGLAAIFTSAFIPSLIMGGTLEAGKLLIISFLYRFWEKINFFYKIYIFILIVLLIIFTSIGIFGYLSASYQSGSIELNDTKQQIQALDNQNKFYQEKLSQLNEQITNAPDKFINRKIKLIKTLQNERDSISKKIDDISKEKITLLSKIIKSEAKVGPITFIAKVLNKPVDNSILYLICFIIIIFDPLAIALTIASNIAIKNHKNTSPAIQDTKMQILSNTKIDEISEKIKEISHKFDKKSNLLNSIKD